MKIHVLAPSGTFVPKTLDTDFLLLAAGSGITPMMAICKSALAEGSGKVVLIYANRDENSVIFGAALRELAAKYPDRLTVVHWLESVQGLPSAAALAALAAPYVGHDAFICGPGPFMAAAEEALKARAPPPNGSTSRCSSRWSPTRSPRWSSRRTTATRVPPPRSSRSTARPTRSRWPRNAKLLDVLLDKGLDAPFSCREGHCGACAVLKKSGDVEMEVNDVLEQRISTRA